MPACAVTFFFFYSHIKKSEITNVRFQLNSYNGKCLNRAASTAQSRPPRTYTAQSLLQNASSATFCVRIIHISCLVQRLNFFLINLLKCFNIAIYTSNKLVEVGIVTVLQRRTTNPIKKTYLAFRALKAVEVKLHSALTEDCVLMGCEFDTMGILSFQVVSTFECIPSRNGVNIPSQ